MEVDVFKAGDERGASMRMLQHLEKYTAHPDATDWAKEFHLLLDPAAGVSLPNAEGTLPANGTSTPPAGTPANGTTPPPSAKP
jgi:hypothetical protein